MEELPRGAVPELDGMKIRGGNLMAVRVPGELVGSGFFFQQAPELLRRDLPDPDGVVGRDGELTPAGSQVTDRGRSGCSRKWRSFPESACQIRTLSSVEPAAIFSPVGSHATEWIYFSSSSGVFTSISRNDLKRMIEDNGGKVSSSISAKTSYIVAGDKMGPSKKTKAEQLNITIISENEFFDLII